MAKKFAIEASSYDNNQPLELDAKERSLRNFINYLLGLLGGQHNGSVTLRGWNDLVAASGTVTIASGSGSITATVNGVGTSVTWATSDTATAAALATAINASANALVNGHVTASSALGVVMLIAKETGVAGNAVTLAASGTGATASGARLTGGTETNINFTF